VGHGEDRCVTRRLVAAQALFAALRRVTQVSSAGDTAITGLVDRILAFRDEPISLQGAQEIDERLGDLIDKEFDMKGLSKEGHNLLDLQTTFRNMILDAGPADTTNGTVGFEAIKHGRAANGGRSVASCMSLEAG
jgi:hypothetical protein